MADSADAEAGEGEVDGGFDLSPTPIEQRVPPFLIPVLMALYFIVISPDIEMAVLLSILGAVLQLGSYIGQPAPQSEAEHHAIF